MTKLYSIHYTKVAVHGATMEHIPHYDQCAYARDVYTCGICASQVSRNHVKLSERAIGRNQGGFVQFCNFRCIFTYYLNCLMI
jgi:hypothetical protein